MTREERQARIDTLTQQRQQLLLQAERQLGIIDGQIELLKELQEADEPEPVPNGEVVE